MGRNHMRAPGCIWERIGVDYTSLAAHPEKRGESVMKLSEMFAKMLGDKDVELPNDAPNPAPKPEPKLEPVPEPVPNPEPKQEPVDIALLKKEIEDLKKANLQLIMQGSLHEEPEQSDEDIIMDLCVRNRRRDGNENNTGTTEL